MMIERTNPSFGEKLPRVTPESVGMRSEDVSRFVDRLRERQVNVHSFLLVRHDKVFAESYYAPYAPDQLQTIYSLSKSFTSMAIGIAQDEGILNLDEKLVDIFADELKQPPCKELAALTLRNCLRMSTGQPKEIPGLDMIQAFFNMPFSDMPGEHFRYNTMATYMLSATLKKRGIDLEEYLQKKLFDPMGIHGMHWMRCSRGIPTGGYGFSVLPEVIAKFGILLKNDGVWEGKRLIPQEYLALATSKQIDNSENNAGEWAHGYGYQFWMCRYDTFRGDGAYGQLCVVTRNKDAVLAMTAYTSDIQAELDVYFEELLLKMKEEPLPENPQAHKLLQEKLGAQVCPVQPVADDPALAFPEEILGKTYVAMEHEIRLTREADGNLLLHTSFSGDAVLTRGALLDQYNRATVSALGFSVMDCISRMLAGYGVTKDGVQVRIFQLEMLSDWLLVMTPCDGGIHIRVRDVHNEKDPDIFDGLAQEKA